MRVFIPDDARVAWRLIGNCIAELHAMAAVQMLLTSLEMWPSWMSHRSVWTAHKDCRFRASTCKLTKVVGGWILHKPSVDHADRVCNHLEQVVVLKGDQSVFLFDAFAPSPWGRVISSGISQELNQFQLCDNATFRSFAGETGISFQIFCGGQFHCFALSNAIQDVSQAILAQTSVPEASIRESGQSSHGQLASLGNLEWTTRQVTIWSDDRQVMVVQAPEHLSADTFARALGIFLGEIGIVCDVQSEAITGDRIRDLARPYFTLVSRPDDGHGLALGSTDPNHLDEVSPTILFTAWLNIFVGLPDGTTRCLRLPTTATVTDVLDRLGDIIQDAHDEALLLFGPRGLETGSLVDHGVTEGAMLRLFFRTAGGGKDIKPGTDLRCLGRAIGLLVGRGADANVAQGRIKELKGMVPPDKFLSLTMQNPDSTALAALLKLGDEHKVDLRSLLPAMSKVPNGAPRSHMQKKAFAELDVANLSFPDGIFCNADGSHAVVHRTWALTSSGLFLVVPKELNAVLERRQCIMPDEHSFLTCKQLGVETPFSEEEVIFPVSDGEHRALARLWLVHLGESKVTLRLNKGAQVQTPDDVVFGITVYRDEWSEDQWTRLTQSPVKEVMRHIPGQSVKDIWGRSWRRESKPSGPSGADEFNFFCRVNEKESSAFLSLSGLTASVLYVSPKPLRKGDQLPKVFDGLRIFWCGKDRSQVLSLALEYKRQGIVRNRKSFGLRVSGDVFEEIWKKRRPGDPMPPSVVVSYKWRLSGIPESADSMAVTSWLHKIGWKAKVLKRLRNSVWLIGSDAEYKEMSSTFNDLPVLIEPVRQTQPEHQIIVAGAWKTPSLASSTVSEDPLQKADPWAKWGTSAQGTPAPRSAQAPTANALQQQDTKIDKMQRQLNALENKLSTHVDQTAAEVKQIRSDLKQSHASFHDTLESAMRHQADRLMQSMETLFRTHTASSAEITEQQGKRVKVGHRGDDMEDDD